MYFSCFQIIIKRNKHIGDNMRFLNKMTKQNVAHITSKVMIIALGLALVGIILLCLSWSRHNKEAEEEAIELAQSVASLLHADHILELQTESVKEREHIALVTDSLTGLVNSSDFIRYACLMGQGKDFTEILVEPDIEYPEFFKGQNWKEYVIKEESSLLIKQGKTLVSKFSNDGIGEWVQVIVPVIHPRTKAVVAALGLFYDAKTWDENLRQEMIPGFLVNICMIALIFASYWVRNRSQRLKKLAIKLEVQENLYRNIFEQAPIGIIFVDYQKDSMNTSIRSINPAGVKILGRDVEQLRKISWQDMSPPEDLKKEFPLFEQFLKGEISSYTIEKRLINDRGLVWINLKVADLGSSQLLDSMYLCLIEDITARKQSDQKWLESERSKHVWLSHLPGMAYRCENDYDWTMKFVSEGCFHLTGYNPEELVNNHSVSFNDIICPEFREMCRTEWNRVLLERKTFNGTYKIITKSGEHKWVLETGQGICEEKNSQKVVALEGIIIDITDQKKQEEQIHFLERHDLLTGLYNRTYMEREKRRLDEENVVPLSILICDIDGLRMINDAYGYDEGDQLILKTAKLLQSCQRKEDIFGHIGGGEFVLLLPDTNKEEVHQLERKIKGIVEHQNGSNKNAKYGINISSGFSTKESDDTKVYDVYKEAAEYLHHGKLLNQNSSHSEIVSSIMSTLYAKSQETEQHGQRLGEICLMIGEKIGLEQKVLDELVLLSKLHDIGKIGVDDRILNKPGKLDDDEWIIMKKHTEIGYRIAMSTPQLEHIAYHILTHHERWDGKGYPEGLQGEAIPIHTRILAIADAYDAMTEDRVYRKALSHEEAMLEIKKNIGTQFDPKLAELFMELMD